MSARILVLRTGQAVGAVHAHCGPFFRLFERTMNAGLSPAEHVQVDEMDITVRVPGDALPPLERYHGVIMTGSPAYVEEGEPWMRYGAALLLALLARELPLLAVCFGHQLLGQALGGAVGKNPRGREMGTVQIELSPVADDPLFGPQAGMPRTFLAQCTHRDVIRQAPAGLQVLGTAPHDGCHLVRAGRRAWGLQFHPEFDDVVMRLYLDARRAQMDEEHGATATDARLARVQRTPDAAALLPRFARLCSAEAVGQGARLA